MLSTLESAIYQDTKTTIGQETLLYTQLEYNLKLCLNSSTARISSCSVISNTHLSDQFIKLSNVGNLYFIVIELLDLPLVAFAVRSWALSLKCCLCWRVPLAAAI